MGTTPKYALPYPELTDVANVPADTRELAEATEAALDLAPDAAPIGMGRWKNTSTALAAGIWATVGYEVGDGQTANGISYAAGICTLSKAGLYQIVAVQHFQPTASGAQALRIMNGSSALAIVQLPSTGSTQPVTVTIVRTYRLLAGDALRIEANSAGGGTAYGSGSRYCYLDITRIAS